MTRCTCNVCGREVNGRVPAARGAHLVTPYRHLPPGELGKGNPYADLGFDGVGWQGSGRWCPGSYEPARDSSK